MLHGKISATKMHRSSNQGAIETSWRCGQIVKWQMVRMGRDCLYSDLSLIISRNLRIQLLLSISIHFSRLYYLRHLLQKHLQVHGLVLNIASLNMLMVITSFNFASSIHQYLSVIMKFKAIYHISFQRPTLFGRLLVQVPT